MSQYKERPQTGRLEKRQMPRRSKRFGVGKEIGGAIYLFRDYEYLLGSIIENAKALLPEEFVYTIVKLNLKNDAVSFIECHDFELAAEPTVGNSIIVHTNGATRKRQQAKDPEIYHHKWLFVKDDFRGFDVEESKRRSRSWLDLPNLDMRRIGKRSYWQNIALPLIEENQSDKGNSRFGDPLASMTNENRNDGSTARSESTENIARHKTAIKRGDFSKPIKCLLRDGLLSEDKTLFDFGCGHGRDLNLLKDINIECQGWDPAFNPSVKLRNAQVVNIGYVINVIEDPSERAGAVSKAWKLADEVLCVAAQVEFAAPNKEQQVYGDGYLTSRGTFQKYYNQHELREYLQGLIGTDAISAAPGIFYLFKCEETKQQFFVNRYQRRHAVPRRRISEVLYEQNKDLLEPFIDRLTQLGRLPHPDEIENAPVLIEKFGSLKRAYSLIQKVTDQFPWEEISQKKAEDLLVYLALSRFQKRPPLSKLPLSVQRDVKVFLGGYKIACARADALLFRAGDPEAIDQACQRATIGKLVDNALILHKSGLTEIEPLLRIYEGCARALVGELDDMNVIKLHRFSGKVSYITYGKFDRDPHPNLLERMKISLRTLNIEWFDYKDWQDPYLLVAKHELVESGYPKKALFERLFQREVKIGIFQEEHAEQIRRTALDQLAKEMGIEYRGHKIGDC